MGFGGKRKSIWPPFIMNYLQRLVNRSDEMEGDPFPCSLCRYHYSSIPHISLFHFCLFISQSCQFGTFCRILSVFSIFQLWSFLAWYSMNLQPYLSIHHILFDIVQHLFTQKAECLFRPACGIVDAEYSRMV